MNFKLSKLANSIEPSATFAIDSKFKDMKKSGLPVINFSIGEPDFLVSDVVKNSAIDAIKNNFTKYTQNSGAPKLKSAIIEKLKRDNSLTYTPEEIVVSNGAKHSIMNALMAICNENDEVLIPVPFWVSYREMVKITGANPIYINADEKNNFKITKKSLKDSITNNTKALILNSPQNPSGCVYNIEELKEIADVIVKKDILVISDEIYEKLIYEGKHVSIASINNDIKSRTITINGVSKSDAMTGFRIGYSASNVIIAKAIDKIQSHMTSNACSISQLAAADAIDKNQSFTEKMMNEYKNRRDYAYEKISKIKNISTIKPDGAFYFLVNIEKILKISKNTKKVINNSEEFCSIFLEEKNVACVPGIAFGIDNHIRISYTANMKEIKEGINRLEEFCNSI